MVLFCRRACRTRQRIFREKIQSTTFEALNKKHNNKFKWWRGREADDDDGDGDGDISSSGERGRRGTRRRREEGGDKRPRSAILP